MWGLSLGCYLRLNHRSTLYSNKICVPLQWGRLLRLGIRELLVFDQMGMAICTGKGVVFGGWWTKKDRNLIRVWGQGVVLTKFVFLMAKFVKQNFLGTKGENISKVSGEQFFQIYQMRCAGRHSYLLLACVWCNETLLRGISWATPKCKKLTCSSGRIYDLVKQ